MTRRILRMPEPICRCSLGDLTASPEKDLLFSLAAAVHPPNLEFRFRFQLRNGKNSSKNRQSIERSNHVAFLE